MYAQRLAEAAEKAKIELSQVQQTQINLPFITATADGPLHLDESLSRSKFQEMTVDLIERCRIPFEQALKDASVTKGDLHHVILVGGATRMPAVQELVNLLTGKEPNKSVNPDEVVAVGAAVQAGVLRGDVKDVLPRRHPVVARHRDQRRRDDEADRAQHDDPDSPHRGVHHRRGHAAVG